MNILIVHNAYQQRGGEDVVVAAEIGMLRRAGHNVHVEIVSNDAIEGVADKLAAFWRAPYDPARGEWVRSLIRQTGAEVLHVHNFFPLLTPAIHEAAAETGIAVVQTLHNFRTICAAAILLRDGVPCEKCVTGSRYWGVVHRCYRNSAMGSLAVVRMQERARRSGVWHRHVHRLITLTEFGRRKLIEGGLPPNRLVVKPNFLPNRGTETAASALDHREGVLFVGRLSVEKGADTLVRAAASIAECRITVVGDGPDRAELAARAPGNTAFLGALPSSEVHEMMSAAGCLVVPSIWYEGFPTVIVEAFAAGLPVVASRIGALAEVVEDGVTGLLFNPGDPADLSAKLTTLLDDPALARRMGERARKVFEERYTERANLPLLEAIYRDAIALRRSEATV